MFLLRRGRTDTKMNPFQKIVLNPILLAATVSLAKNNEDVNDENEHDLGYLY